MPDSPVHTWVVDYPAGAAAGERQARCRIDPTDVLWLYSAPDRLAVTVREGDHQVVARSEPLERQGEQFPMTRLVRDSDTIRAGADLGQDALARLLDNGVGTPPR